MPQLETVDVDFRLEPNKRVALLDEINQQEWLKRNCHKLVNDAINSGLLKRPEVCSKCGDSPKAYDSPSIIAHHEDYTKPYAITWLCYKCHGKHHYEKNLHGRPPMPQPEFRPMTADEVKRLVGWIKRERHASLTAYQLIKDSFASGRATGLNDVLKQLRKMGVITDAS